MTSLTSSAMFHPLQIHLVSFQTEAIPEMSLHSSILSSKINKLLPTPSTDNKTDNNHPTMISLHTLANPPSLPTLTLHLCKVVATQQPNFTKKLPSSCMTPHIRCTPTPCTSIYQGHQQWWPRFATYQHHSWTLTSSWYAPQLPLFSLFNGFTTNNWATQQCSPTNESCHHLSSDWSRLTNKSPWTDQHP